MAKFSEDVRRAYQHFLTTHDPESADAVVIAIVMDFIPKRAPGVVPARPADSARLMADLGFDSLAIAETVFFLEDLFQVRISNEEIMSVQTVAELRAFVRQKIATRETP